MNLNVFRFTIGFLFGCFLNPYQVESKFECLDHSNISPFRVLSTYSTCMLFQHGAYHLLNSDRHPSAPNVC